MAQPDLPGIDRERTESEPGTGGIVSVHVVLAFVRAVRYWPAVDFGTIASDYYAQFQQNIAD